MAKKSKSKPNQKAKGGAISPPVKPFASRGKSRVMRSSLKDSPIYGSNYFSSNSVSLPSAFVNIDVNTTFCKSSGAVKHPQLGIDGISLVGCQPLADITTTGADSQLFVTGVASVPGVNSIQISPDAFNGPLAAQANLHQKYVFRDVLIEYISNVATSQAGSFAIAILSDSSLVNPPTSFSTTRQVVPSITAPFRADRAYLHYHYDGWDTWFTELDGASIAGNRLTSQGAIIGFPSATSLGAISMGFTNVWYVIELYQPTSTQGFTMGLRDHNETLLVRAFLKKLRSTTEEEIEIEGFAEIPQRVKTCAIVPAYQAPKRV